MKPLSPGQTRRDFIRKAGAGTLAITTLTPFGMPQAAVLPVKKDHLFTLGIAGYTFVKTDLDSALAMMSKVGMKFLSIKDFHLPLESTAEQIGAFQAKLAEHGVTGYCVGPIYMRSEQAIDQAFAYARRVGVPMVIGVPDYPLLPYAEKKVKEYGIKLAIHNHGPDNLPYPTAGFIMEKIDRMDERMGICLDIGHNIRAGEDPAAAVKKFSHRIFDMHIKDVTEASKAGKNLEVGRGIIDIPGFFSALAQTKYSGVCSLEYEKDNTDPMAGIAESTGYLRGVLDTI